MQFRHTYVKILNIGPGQPEPTRVVAGATPIPPDKRHSSYSHSDPNGNCSVGFALKGRLLTGPGPSLARLASKRGLISAADRPPLALKRPPDICWGPPEWVPPQPFCAPASTAAGPTTHPLLSLLTLSLHSHPPSLLLISPSPHPSFLRSLLCLFCRFPPPR